MKTFVFTTFELKTSNYLFELEGFEDCIVYNAPSSADALGAIEPELLEAGFKLAEEQDFETAGGMTKINYIAPDGTAAAAKLICGVAHDYDEPFELFEEYEEKTYYYCEIIGSNGHRSLHKFAAYDEEFVIKSLLHKLIKGSSWNDWSISSMDDHEYIKFFVHIPSGVTYKVDTWIVEPEEF